MDIEEYELRNNNKSTKDCRLETKQTKEMSNDKRTTPKHFLTPRTKPKIRIVPPFSTQSLQQHTKVWNPPKRPRGMNTLTQLMETLNRLEQNSVHNSYESFFV